MCNLFPYIFTISVYYKVCYFYVFSVLTELSTVFSFQVFWWPFWFAAFQTSVQNQQLI